VAAAGDGIDSALRGFRTSGAQCVVFFVVAFTVQLKSQYVFERLGASMTL